MRIISGTAKGCKLLAPAGEDVTRPTLERHKDSLFNIINPRLPGCRFLDLFCGSGSPCALAGMQGKRRIVLKQLRG